MKKVSKGILFLFYIIGMCLIGYQFGIYAAEHSWGVREFGFLVLSGGFSFFIHLIVHEIGHLIAGILSGYTFMMFRLFNWIWVKEDNRVVRRKQKVAGLLGQCLMLPHRDQEYPPYKLYHLGGVLTNAFFILFAFIGEHIFFEGTVSIGLIGFIFIGLVFVILNLVPMGSNDGMNLWKSCKSKAQQKVIKHSLWIYAGLVQGKTYTELEEFIYIDDTKPISEASNAFMKTIEAGSYIMKNQFEEATKILYQLWEKFEDLSESHKIDIVKETLFLLLLTDPDDPAVKTILETKEFKAAQKIKQADSKRMNALYEWVINRDITETVKQLEEAKKLITQAPTLTEQKMEEHLIHYIELMMR